MFYSIFDYLIQLVLQHVPHEHWQPREEGVEAPVLCEVSQDDGPDGLGGQHALPRRGHHALLQWGKTE